LEQHWAFMKHPKLPDCMQPQRALLHWFVQQDPALEQNEPSARQAAHVLNPQFPEQHDACPSPHAAPVAAQPAGPHVPAALQSF
jgi:hypothetical protein